MYLGREADVLGSCVAEPLEIAAIVIPQLLVGKGSTFRDATKHNNSYNNYFDQGLQKYHQKGW